MSETIRWRMFESSFGTMLVAASARGICRVGFGIDAGDLANRFPGARTCEDVQDADGLFRRVAEAVENPRRIVDIPLDMGGTAFQRRVWEALRRIPSGETVTYGELAAQLGDAKAGRAVGAANGANRIAVLIPCHRVVQSDGSLGGYAWGLDMKRELLRREGALLL